MNERGGQETESQTHTHIMDTEEGRKNDLSFGITRILSSRAESSPFIIKKQFSNVYHSNNNRVDLNSENRSKSTEVSDMSTSQTNVSKQEVNSGLMERIELVLDCASNGSRIADISERDTTVISPVNDQTVIPKTTFPFTQSFLLKPSMERLRHKVYGKIIKDIKFYNLVQMSFDRHVLCMIMV